MAAITDDPDRCRPTFAELRGLRDRLQREVGSTHRLEHLSMGTSQDYSVAVEEGATIVRIGTKLYD